MNNLDYKYSEKCLTVWRDLVKSNHLAIYYNNLAKDYLDVGFKFNNLQLISEVFDFMNVPNNLTLKEKIAYYQLLEEK